MVGILRGRGVLHLEVTADEEFARHLDCLGDWSVGLGKRGIGRVSKLEAGERKIQGGRMTKINGKQRDY
jgi:hypothetical protein